MKRILACAAMLAASCALADSDQYLFWMISSDATVGGQSLEDANVHYARITVTDGQGTHYLNLYANGPGTGTGIGYLPIQKSDPFPVYAGLFDSSATSFLIELYSDMTWTAENRMGEAYFDYAAVAQYIGQGSLVHPSDFMTITQFYAVPEPTSGLLLLLGVAGLALRRRKFQGA